MQTVAVAVAPTPATPDLFTQKKVATQARVLEFFATKNPKLSACAGRLDVARFWYDGFSAWYDSWDN